MTKHFRIKERHDIMFPHAEFFNAFNHINLGAPGLVLKAPSTFGIITTSVREPQVFRTTSGSFSSE